MFAKRLNRGNNKVLTRLMTISRMSSSVHKARTQPDYIKVKFWGVPTGLTFKTSSKDKHVLTVGSVKEACPSEGRNKLIFGDVVIAINDTDVRGKLDSETKKIYRNTCREQGSSSTSEEPAMWYMIFRRGDPLINEETMTPSNLCIRHSVSDAFDDALEIKSSEIKTTPQQTKVTPWSKISTGNIKLNGSAVVL
jgi:hypothetical protein